MEESLDESCGSESSPSPSQKRRSTEGIRAFIAKRWAPSSSEPLIMASSPHSSLSSAERRVSPSIAPLPPSTNDNNEDSLSLSESLRRLDLSAASRTALPPSPAPGSPLARHQSLSATPNGKQQRSPLRRSPSSMSIESRSTPTLLRKASMNSLHGTGGVTPNKDFASRRASSAQFPNRSPSSMSGRTLVSDMEEMKEEVPRHTAASIAQNHFKSELDLHDKEGGARPADTIVILHDSCYGHRYSRPRTSRASLNTIVERPERIHASILGLSVAYVRLGERHFEGLHPPHPNVDPCTISNTPFRIRKTTRRLSLSSQAVTNVHGTKWMEELKIMCDSAEAKLAMNGKELVRPEISRTGEQSAPPKLHEGDLYLCSESLNAMEGALGAVCEGVDAVFEGSANGKGPHRTFVAIRPPGHHCSADYPSGFCWLNNVHVGISHAALAHNLTHAAIIDFDLHHGDGSQAIAWQQNARATNLGKNALQWKKTSIGYFSLHDINSYPCEMGDEEKVKNASLCIENAHGQSIWNVHLQSWKTEKEFWELYETKYSVLLEKTRNYLRAQTERLRSSPNLSKPKAAIFLSAGFDASEWESSGMQRHKVNVPTEFYARLTRDVVKLASEEGTGVEGRVISVLEGGYSDRALCTGVLSHLSGLAGGDTVAIKQEVKHSSLGYEMGQKIGAFNGADEPLTEVSTGTQTYDPLWWSLPRLEQLDAVVSPPPQSVEPKKSKDTPPPTYYSPTQSFIAKVSPRVQRSVSNMSNRGPGSQRPISRAPTPPPPEVHWTVAAHELSKLLIPKDRQTMSCKVEDLSAEATRQRRDRQSVLTPPVPNPEANDATNARMALRARKPTKVIETPEENEVKKPKTSRRKTVAGTAGFAAEKAIARSATPKPELPSYTQPTQSSRRLSIASNSESVMSEAASARLNGPQNSRVPSNGTVNISQRPISSQGVRPEPSMSSRGHSIPPVVVRKTRAPAHPRAEVKTSRVRRKSPLNDTAENKQGDKASGAQSRSTSVTRPPAQAAATQTSDIDKLTSGMKKIKINLTTKAQREAREKAKLAEKESNVELAVKKEAAQLTVPQLVSDGPEVVLPKAQISIAQPPCTTNTLVENVPFQSLLEEPTLPSHLTTHFQEPTQVPLPASSPPAAGFTFHVPEPPQKHNDMDTFVPFKPEGPPPAQVLPKEPLHWLPPNMATPVATKRNDLPVFTSTSAIPFGKSNTNQSVSMNNVEQKQSVKSITSEPSIWDIPMTPQSS